MISSDRILDDLSRYMYILYVCMYVCMYMYELSCLDTVLETTKDKAIIIYNDNSLRKKHEKKNTVLE